MTANITRINILLTRSLHCKKWLDVEVGVGAYLASLFIVREVSCSREPPGLIWLGGGCGCLPCVLVYCQGGILF